VEFSSKINIGREQRNRAASPDQWISDEIFFVNPAETPVPRGFCKSGLCKILFSKNLDIKILRTNSLAGAISR
jgi:hypothetical protein